MKHLCAFVFFCIGGLFFTSVTAQDQPAPVNVSAPVKKDTLWRHNFKLGANITQSYVSESWKSGGANAFATSLFFNGTLNYKKGFSSFDSEIELVYGNVWNAPNLPRKTTDRIWIDTKYGYGFSKSWSLFASGNFLSQFYRGEQFVNYSPTDNSTYANTISSFMAPGYFTEALGLEYKPVTYFFARFGLVAMRQTIQVSDEVIKNLPSNYGVEEGNKIKNEGASQILSQFDKDVLKDFNVKVRALVFKGWASPWSFDQVNTRIDLSLTAKVNKYVNVNVQATGLYQREQDLRMQWSQLLSLGFLTTF